MRTIQGLVGIVLCGFLQGCGSGAATVTVPVGHVATLSGPDKRAGEKAMQGIRLALEALNRNPDHRQIVVRHADTLGKIDGFESQAVRLVGVNRCAGLLGGTHPAEVLRMDRARVSSEGPPIFLPILSPSGQRTPTMSDQVFLTGISPTAQAEALGRFAAEEKDWKKLVVIVQDQEEDSRIQAEAFQIAFQNAREKKKANGDRLTLINLGKETRLAEVWKNLADNSPDAIYWAGSNKEILQSKIGDKSPVILFGGTDGSVQPGDVAADQEVILASAFGVDDKVPTNQEFLDKFQALFKEPPDVYAALAYDNMKILGKAIHLAPTMDRVRETILKMRDIPTTTGPLNFNNDQTVRRPIYVQKADGSNLRVLKKYP